MIPPSHKYLRVLSSFKMWGMARHRTQQVTQCPVQICSSCTFCWLPTINIYWRFSLMNGGKFAGFQMSSKLGALEDYKCLEVFLNHGRAGESRYAHTLTSLPVSSHLTLLCSPASSTSFPNHGKHAWKSCPWWAASPLRFLEILF